MDHGFAPGATLHDARLRAYLQRRVPATSPRRPRGGTLHHFIDDLDTDASVTKPVDDLVFGTHASSEGFLFNPMFPGQVNVAGDPTDVSDYEVLESAVPPPRPIRVPDGLVGFTAPPPTHALHIKGCNIGQDRFDSTRTPAAPYLVKLKEALGGTVNVTAPRHFHGLLPLDSGDGTFEFMAQEFVVRTIAVPAGRRFRGFANRAALLAAFDAAGFRYHDGTAIPTADWGPWVPRSITRTAARTVTHPLGQTVAGMTTLGVPRQFRSELAEVMWTFTPGGAVPGDRPGRLAMIRASVMSDARFQAAHQWPAHERVGFSTAAAWFDGHHWSFAVNAGTLVAVGRRFDYTVVLPIVDRSVTPAADRPLVFNFHPAPSTAHTAITAGLQESDGTFFGRA